MRTGNLVDDGKYFGLPVLTTTQRDALTPSAGWKIFNSTSGAEEVYNGSTWLSNKIGAWTYALNDCDFGNSGSKIIWSTKLVPFLSGMVDTVQIYLTQAGTGATRVGIYNSSENLVVSSASTSSLPAGMNTFTLTAGTFLTAGSTYWLALQTWANGGIFAGKNNGYSPNNPYHLARLDTNNAPDPTSGMVSSLTSYSTSGIKLWANVYKA